MATLGIPTDELPIPLRQADLVEAYNRGDQIEWLILNGTIIAGYLWFEKKPPDCLFVFGTALQKNFMDQALANISYSWQKQAQKKLIYPLVDLL